MSYIVNRIEPVVYSNVNKGIEYVPLENYSFIIPVSKGTVDFIGLFFSAEGNVKGTLNIELYIDKTHKRYEVDSNQIVADSPTIFSIYHTFKQDCLVKVSLTFRKKIGSGNFKIKITDSGPCMYVEGTRTSIFDFNNPPLISIITPTYKTNIDYLKTTVKSVTDQSYEKWEWCIVDDGSNDPELVDYLRSIESDKIKIFINNKNKGIVSATNDAISMATGEYVAFLDHDDILDKDAILYVADVINKDPDTHLIYTDEDKVLEDGRFVGPFYKPDFNYSLLLSSMYTCHLSVYKRSIVNLLGGIRKGFDGSQDYDLALRFIEHTRNIKHIPRILYHWRITPNSTSSSITNKPDARINGARALADHLRRIKRRAMVTAGHFPGHYDVRYIIRNKPKISIIIPFRDQISILNNLLKTFEMTSYKNYEILLVDNDSEKPDTHEYLNTIKDKKIRILKYSGPFNFSKINNYAVSVCSGSSDLILFLNNDIEIMHPNWLNNMVQHFVRPEVAAVGAKLLYLDHRIQHAGVIVGVNGVAGHSHKMLWDWDPGYFSRPHLTQDITAVTGACMLVRKGHFLRVQGFDPELPTAFNDIDLCLKFREIGKSIVYTPFARLYHRESVSRGYDSITDDNFLRSVAYISDKWDLANFVDPFYNPNLPDNCEGRHWV